MLPRGDFRKWRGNAVSANGDHRHSRRRRSAPEFHCMPSPVRPPRRLKRRQKASCSAWSSRNAGRACPASRRTAPRLRCLVCTFHNGTRKSAWAKSNAGKAVAQVRRGLPLAPSSIASPAATINGRDPPICVGPPEVARSHGLARNSATHGFGFLADKTSAKLEACQV